MFGGIWRRLRTWCKADKNRSLMLIVTTAVFFLGLGILLADYKYSMTAIEDGLTRNSYGKGNRTEELEVAAEDGEKTKMQVEVSEQKYTGKEIQDLFRRSTLRMEKLILGENESLDRVESDLNLLTEMPDEPVEVSWELDRYDVMNIYGELQQDMLVPEGTMVNLTAVLTYREDKKEEALYECSAMVYPRTKNSEEKRVAELQASIKKADEKTKTEKVLKLPKEIDGQTIRYYPQMQKRGIVLMTMAVMLGILLYALEKQNEGQERQKKRKQMMLDYPEIINKLTLFLGAGMTVKRAWKKVVQDYEIQREVCGTRYAYEEMRQTFHEMDSGITETESYVRFGKRCNIQEYVRLGALLSQNLRRGTKGLNQILKLEAMQAFEERKARAKRLGEEAGTKLLGPMFLMLAEVLVLVIIPAFMSIQV